MTGRRVAHVVRSNGFAGVERYMCDTAGELDRRGWQVTVIGGDPVRMRAELAGGVDFQPARTTLQVARALWAAGAHEIVHTHMTAAEAGAALTKGLRFDRWVTTRHFASPRGSSTLGRAFSPLIRRRVDLQIAISRYVAESIDGRSVVLHHGVPPSTQPPRDRDHTVVMMQRLEPEKDTATGLRAWALSRLAADGWRLRVFGRGAGREELEGLAADLGVADSVTFEGFATDPRRVLAEAGIVLATTPIEAFGLTVVEAMAEGAPVVAADAGAHRETLGDDSVLFAPGDAAAAAAGLQRLAAEDSARAKVGADLRTRYEAGFTLATHVDRLEEMYLR